MRKEIKEFAEEMERVMKKHDKKKGDSWKEEGIDCDDYLWEKLDEEYIECVHESADIKKELIDLANVSMMLWWRERQK